MSKSSKEQQKEVIIKLWIPAKNLKYVNTGKFVDIDTLYMNQMAVELGARWAFYVRDKRDEGFSWEYYYNKNKGKEQEFVRLEQPISTLCGTGSTDAKAFLKAVSIFPYEGEFKDEWERCIVGPKGLTSREFLFKIWKEKIEEDNDSERRSLCNKDLSESNNCFLRIDTNAWSLSKSPDLKKIIANDILYKNYKAENHIFFDSKWFYKDMCLMNYKCTRGYFDQCGNWVKTEDRDCCFGKELERIEIRVIDPDLAWLTLAKPTGLDMFK